MSLRHRFEAPAVPVWLAALPFLCAPNGRKDEDMIANAALASAAAALAADSQRRDSRSRLCFLLAELAAQYGRRTGDGSGLVPVGRARIACAAQISLPRVKRILGFLALSGTIDLREDTIRILDWGRLCKLGAYDRSWAQLPVTRDEDGPQEGPVMPLLRDAPSPAFTAAGDPASFV